MGLTLCPEGVSSSSITMRGPEINPSSARWNIFTSKALFLPCCQGSTQRIGCVSNVQRAFTMEVNSISMLRKKDRNKGNKASSILNFLLTELVLNTSHMNAISFENLKFTAQRIITSYQGRRDLQGYIFRPKKTRYKDSKRALRGTTKNATQFTCERAQTRISCDDFWNIHQDCNYCRE